ncbi:MAG: penicillin-binding protein [Candidatus Korobacteraceae bacterium]
MNSYSPTPVLKNPRARLVVFGAVLALWVAVIGGRLAYLQVIRYGALVQYASRQQQRTIDISPKRGIIYDRNGQELAMSLLVDSAYAVPSQVPDQETTAALLASVLGGDAQEILARMKSQRHFAWVARKVDAETADKIRALNLHGIGFHKEPKRFYPKRELAAQILGYVGLDDEALAGIELAFAQELRGTPGTMMISQDARRRWFGRIERQPEAGANVVLTIDEKIQYIAEKEIEQAIENTQAKAATIVIQNPRTGEILALANRPTFNPNLSKEITPAALKDHAVSDVYEPGSVFKTVTYSSALEEHLTRLDEMISCDPGFIMVGGIKIRDAHRLGTISVEQAFAHSSDVGAVKIGLRLGPERLFKHMLSFGFGQQTGIELPGETRGLLKPPKDWAGSSIGAMSIGQEVGVTPLQIISMVSAIANDGIYSAPRIVAGVTSPAQGFQQIVFRPREQRRVVSSLTAAQMRRMMAEVVQLGTAREAQLNGYTAAGKTGTAQQINPATHRYSATDYVASFVGFAPVNNPAVTIAVILDSPQGLHQGGQVSAPIFKRVAEQVLSYLNVAHDAEIKNDPRQALMARSTESKDASRTGSPHAANPAEDDPGSPQGSSPDAAPASAGAEQAKFVSKPAADALLPAAFPISTGAPANSGFGFAGVSVQPVSAAEPVQGQVPPHPPGSLVLEVGGQTVPDFSGKSLRAAIELAEQSGLELSVSGSGMARAQSPAPGARVAPHSKVIVRFGR